MSYLLDTNILSEIRKGERADPSVLSWWRSTDENGLFLSVLVLGEIRRGIEKLRRRDLARAQSLEFWMGQVISGFKQRILPIDRKTADIWGSMGVERTLPLVDSLMAATAVANNLIFVTRNIRDMQSTGTRILNPFDS